MNSAFQNSLRKLAVYYQSGSRWWIPLAAGALYSFALPPLNHETHWSLALFPFLSFIVLLPLFGFAVQPSLKRAALHSYLYGYTAAFGQYHWLVFDNVEGLWHLVIIGLFLTSAVIGCLYLAAGLLFRITVRSFPKAYVFIFPAIWVTIDYLRTLGDLAFPWAFLGYALTPLLPLAQLASVTGVWGLTFIIVMGNTLVWQSLHKMLNGATQHKLLLPPTVFVSVLLVICIGGLLRMRDIRQTPGNRAKISLLQPNIDQFRWRNDLLDTAFAVCESLMVSASREKPDLMVLPESAFLCYITHRRNYQKRLSAVLRRVGTPLIFGSLDWQQAKSGSSYETHVFNSAFYADTCTPDFKPYHKIKLVPFSEAIPFEGLFPLLSRVNLGEADFQRGSGKTVFTVGEMISSAPFICYESIFPDFVRRRVREGINLMVNITNDGWFGRSSGPYHHAMMARMRSIENGIALARCANSGISMFVDPTGAVNGSTPLYSTTILTRAIPITAAMSIYRALGDWFVAGCVILLCIAGTVAAVKQTVKKRFR
ncbi:MAG: apolipoprotein N-acyltransferase [Chitinispirillaceae bacterium]|nr:apolipoprotein N-acyltransferase [Chitinispirillaceae bacterium]